MKIRPAPRDVFWMTLGAILLFLGVLLPLHFHREQNPDKQIAFKSQRVELVERMRLSLATASEAEKSAVMAITDSESQTFADQARAASAQVAQGREDLGRLLETGGTKGERDFLAQFSQAFDECQRIDSDLLSLAVKNTNLKAYSLAFGPAADACKEMDDALTRIEAESADSPGSKGMQTMRLAAGAQSGVLRIQALLPPHISEESDAKMDALEASMAKEDKEIRKALDGLAALIGSGKADLETASSSYARFTDLKAQILSLSRQNTNVRSLTISLNQKRTANAVCQDALAAIEKAIRDEPLSLRTPVNPR